MAVDVRGFDLGIDVSPAMRVIDAIGQRRRQETQQDDLAQLLSRARGGDTEALNMLAVKNPNLGNYAQGQINQGQQDQARQQSELVSNMIDMPAAKRAEYADSLYQNGLIDQDDYQSVIGLLGEDEETQSNMLTNMLIGLGDDEFLKQRGIGLGAGSSVPASVREYEFVQSLSPEERDLYFTTKRGDNATLEEKFQQAKRAAELETDTEQAKAERKAGVTELNKIAERGRTATSQTGMINRLAMINKKAVSGAGAGVKLQAMKLASTLGLPTPDGVTESELMEAISNELTLDKSQKMSGALSENDMIFLQRTVPMLSQTQEGREKVIEYQKALLTREREYAKAAREFRRKNGYFDLSEFNDEFDAANKPLFSEADAQVTPPSNETKEQRLKRMREKYGVAK